MMQWKLPLFHGEVKYKHCYSETNTEPCTIPLDPMLLSLQYGRGNHCKILKPTAEQDIFFSFLRDVLFLKSIAMSFTFTAKALQVIHIAINKLKK